MAASSFSFPCYYFFLVFLTLALSGVNSKAFDHYLLALQWAPAVAFGAFPDFKIHGLWANNSTDPSNPPRNCNPNDVLDLNNIATLISDLHKFWPSLLRSKTDEEFWAHEWSTHGTCSGYSQFDYFDTTLIPSKYQIITGYSYNWHYPRIKCLFKRNDWILHEIHLNFTDSVVPQPQDIFTNRRTVGCSSTIVFC